MGNPASLKCIQDGGNSVILSGEGGEYGVCIFADNSVCEEWRYFRKECKKGDCLLSCRNEGDGLYDCMGKLVRKGKCGGNEK